MNIMVIFYHPKNPQNIHDLAFILSHLNIELLVVKRPDTEYNLSSLPQKYLKKVHILESLEEAIKMTMPALYLVLETYADKHLDKVLEEALEKYLSNKLVILVGAEDYGIPFSEVKKIPEPVYIAKIPVAVQGASYNVVVATIIALYEVARVFSK